MGILLFFSFVSGLVTIAAPCIWPLLPIILSSTTIGGHRKPLGVTLGIISSFGVFTLTISYIIRLFPFDPNTLRLFAVIVISFLGITLIVPKFSRIIESLVSKFSSRFGITSSQENSGFWSGLLTGFALGIVWTPCAGPILATIATLAATQSVTFNLVLVTVVYLIGVGIPLFIFATLGRTIFTKSRILSKYTGRIQQIFGVTMLLTAFLIWSNYDKVLQAKLLDLIPSYSNFITRLESNNAVKSQLDNLKGSKSLQTIDTSGLFNSSIPAPEFKGIKWLNPEKSLSINDLKGKVILVDFWTYTCINCIRTLPHVTAWYDKYESQGFVVIGVHTPEFEFEKDTNNVLNAIKQFNIHYPVLQDNDYSTWNNYSNQYWPAEYLIDSKGIIRRTHFGEGEYEEMEMAIQVLLEEVGKKTQMPLDNIKDTTPTTQMSPETYLGTKRMQYYYKSGNTNNGIQTFNIDNKLTQNSFSLGGEWNITEDEAITGKNSVLLYNFYANKVYLVLRPGENKKGVVKVFLDGKTVDITNAGSDVVNGTVIVDEDRLYNLVDLKDKVENHILRLEFETPGVEVFAFTFG